MKSNKEQGIDREPINLTMKQLKEPEVREAYLALLEAKNDDFMAELDVWSEFYDDNLQDEIKHQLAQAEIEAKLEAHVLQEAFNREMEQLAFIDKEISQPQQQDNEYKLTDRDKIALEALRNVIDERFKNDPIKRQAKHDALNAKLPDIVAGKHELIPPTITVQPTVEVKTRNKVNQDNVMDR